MSDHSPINKNAISNGNFKNDNIEASSLSLPLVPLIKECKKSSSDKKELKKIIAKEQKKMDKILRKKKKAEKKTLKKLKKEKRKIKKLLKKKQKIEEQLKIKEIITSIMVPDCDTNIPDCDTNIPDCDVIKNEDVNISKLKAPMTKEEWEAQQSVIKRVFDPETGRHRLVKGTGEILEECVSRERHKEINKVATKGDGLFYQSTIMSKIKRV